jgi:hypothetical protein
MRGYKKILGVIPRISSSIVGINITARTITCSWIEKVRNQAAPYELKAYKHILLEVHPKTTLTIYNPTRLRSIINTFLDLHNLKDACIVAALSGDGITEKQIMLNKPTAALSAIEGTDPLSWHYYCLQEDSVGPQAPWYTCGMKREILFQYQLLAMSAGINLIQITTPTMALLKAYKFLKGDNNQRKTNIVDCLNLNGHIRIRSPHDHAAIVESFGLFLLGKQINEEH